MLLNKQKQKININSETMIIIVIVALLILNIVLWLVFLCGNDLHYRNVGKITSVIPYDTVAVHTPNKTRTKVLYEYHYIDNETGEELIQTSDDIKAFIDVGTEDHIRKHNRKYFYEYRALTNNVIYFCFVIICLFALCIELDWL